jgi:hypothetical protein
VTKGYIILAALKLLGLSSLDQFESIKTSTEKEEQKSFLEKLSSDIVSQFIATEEFKFEQTVLLLGCVLTFQSINPSLRTLHT